MAPTQQPMPDAHLQASSPARSAADPASVPRPGETDFDGRPRLAGVRLDGGALLYAGTVMATTSAAAAGELHLYPVPAQQLVQLHMPFAQYAAAFYDDQGRLVWHQAASPAQLSLATLPPGAYLLRVTSASGQTRTQRLVKE